MQHPPVFVVSREEGRWNVTVDGETLVVTGSARAALATALEAAQILRRAGVNADVRSAPEAWDEPRSFEPNGCAPEATN